MSRSKPATYGELMALLDELGFLDESVADSHRALRHSRSETLILLAPFETGAPVRKEDLISVRRHLDASGLMNTLDFDRRIPQTAATKDPSADAR